MEGKSSSLTAAAAAAEPATCNDSEEIVPSSSSNLEGCKVNNNPPMASIHVKFADDSKPPRDSKGIVEISTQSFKREHSLQKPQRRKTTLLEHSPIEYGFVVGLGMLMSFIAGYSNAVCLSGNIQRSEPFVKHSVAGVTGAYTGSAIDILQGNWVRYRLNVGTILSVFGGACIASLFNPYPIPFQLCPRYGITFLIGGFLTTLGAVSDMHNDGREYYFTAMGNGIMNGIASMYTANLIRTTHLTGITTDIGLFVGQVLCGNRMNLWRLYILAGLAFSFFLGSLGGYGASVVEREYALIMNACFFYAFGISIIVYNFNSHDEMNWCDAIFGVGFCSSSNHYDENHHEYDTGCIDTDSGIFRLCGSGVWCCKRSREETQRVSILNTSSEPNLTTNDADPEGNNNNNNNNNDDDDAVADTSGRHKRRFTTLMSDCARISRKELMEIFDMIDDGDGYASIQEFVLEVLHVERLWGELEQEDETRISASRRSECIAHSQEFRDHSHRSSSRTHNNSIASLKSHAMNSIDTLRIASIREIESTGHHVG